LFSLVTLTKNAKTMPNILSQLLEDLVQQSS
jgi:hypothetical protein